MIPLRCRTLLLDAGPTGAACSSLLHAPPSAGAILVFGTWQPGATPFGTCTQHIAAPFQNSVFVTDAAGFVRTEIPFSLNPALIHGDLGLQAIVVPAQGPQLLTNALHVVVGGAL